MGQGHSAVPDSYLLVDSSHGLHYHRSNSRELFRTDTTTEHLRRFSGSVRCPYSHLPLDCSHSYLPARQHPPHSQQRLLPPLLRLHSGRTSIKITLANDLLRDRNGRKPRLRRLRSPRLLPGPKRLHPGLRRRCVRRYLWNNGNGSRTKSRDPAHLPSRSRHFRKRWRPRPPRRTRRRANPERILVTWRRILPRNLVIDSPSGDDLLGINRKSLDRSATGDVLCNIRTSFGLDGT